MGVDLTLLPLISKDYWAAHDMINLERRSELWPLIEALPQKDIPQALSCFLARGSDGESKYGQETRTPYGMPMRYTTVGDLLALRDSGPVQNAWRNKAAWAYLAEMPPDWPIVLYWR